MVQRVGWKLEGIRGGMHYITATIFDSHGRVLSIGTNDYNKSHPLQAKFAIRVGQPERIYLHAELAALTKLKRKDKAHKIKVERYKKDGTPGNARPCAICEAAIRSYGIKYVEHTV